MPRTFIPPKAVADQARMGLALRESLPPSQRCCTSVGIRRAVQLANRQPVSVGTLKRMRSYFQRHAVDARGVGWHETSKGWQAWLCWGGDSGRAWCNQMLAKVEPTRNPAKGYKLHKAPDGGYVLHAHGRQAIVFRGNTGHGWSAYEQDEYGNQIGNTFYGYNLKPLVEQMVEELSEPYDESRVPYYYRASTYEPPADKPIRYKLRRNPRPIPLNQEVVQAIYDAVIDALEQARKAARKGDLLYDALNRTNLQRGDRKGVFVLGTFPMPVYRGSKFAPLYREVPVVLWPSTEKRKGWLYGGAVPINENDPTADLPYLALKYTAILPMADLPRNLHGYVERYTLLNTIVHEMTHAADFFRLRKHVPSGRLRIEKGEAAYYNQPMEVRAHMQEAVRGFKQDLSYSSAPMEVEEWLRYAKSGGMDYWKHLTPANQRKFLQALYAAKQEIMAERAAERGE